MFFKKKNILDAVCSEINSAVDYYDEQGKYTKSNVESAVQNVLGSIATIDEEIAGVYTVTTEKENVIDISDIIKNASDYAETSIIDFTIGGTTYEAEEGMTWEEWVNSSYNVIPLYIVYNYVLAGTDGGRLLEDDSGNVQMGSMAIIHETAYSWGWKA